MNSYRLNGSSNYWLRQAIATNLGIAFNDVYKTIKDIQVINKNVIIEDKVGNKYKLTLEYIK